jgi:DNA topoisomerase-1
MHLPHLSHTQFLNAGKDGEKAATLVKLVYVKDSAEGISRFKKGSGFTYFFNNKPVRDASAVERIHKLAIPPAWTNVWICPLANGHIQATGLDVRNRKQYRYHAAWNLMRSETKFHHLYEFGKTLPAIRATVEKDLAEKELTQKKVLALVVSLMEKTHIRIGNKEYEKLNGSYGLTTLKNKHAHINGSSVVFSFKGKKGVRHDITLQNKKLVKAVKQCREIPGKELFQYYDAEGNRHPVDSGMVNQYIKEISGGDFSAKDFRTWAGSLHALEAFSSLDEALTEGECKKNIIAVLDAVSKKLGNTRNVCKKYYVHPVLLKLYEEKKLHSCLKTPGFAELNSGLTRFSPEEETLMRILKDV